MRSLAAVALALCILVAAVAYSNSLGNQFALDDGHTIQSNPWVRSLAHVPRYYVDASTFSTLATNVDYRPFLQTTYAVNYALAGYDVRAWRLVNLGLHVVVAWSVFLLGRRLFGTRALAPLPGLSPADGDLASLAAALLFAVHPVGSGIVNYVSARSSGLAAALMLPALVLYLRVLARRRARLAHVGSLALFALALLTKVEAVSLLAVLALAEVLLDPAKRGRAPWRRLFDRPTWLRLLPFALVAGAYLAMWQTSTGLGDPATRAGGTMTPWVYLLTQLRAWWYYVGLVAAPLELVADYPSYPVSRSILDPAVLLALAGWIAVAALACAAARRAPAVTFLVLSFFLYLAPHSSLVPLAEPVNEHRPYLAASGLFLLAAALGVATLRRLVRRPALGLAALVALLLVPLVALTRERNRDWRDAETLWADTAAKAPDSPRAQMNYGLALMRRGRLAEAEARFREATRLAPGYSLAHTNLAIVLAAQGEDAAARRAFDGAVRIAPKSDAPLYWRGRFLASRGELEAAERDFAAAARSSSAPFREWAALAEVLARQGRDAEAEDVARRGTILDPGGFAAERVEFRTSVLARRQPSPGAARSAVAVMNEGVAVMGAGRLAEAEALFAEALAIDPHYALVHTNLGIVRAALGRGEEARAAHDRAVAVGAGTAAPLYWRGRFLLARGDVAGAIDDLGRASELEPDPRHLAALAEALARAGRHEDAAAAAARGEAIDAGAFAREREALAGAVPPRG